MLKPDDLKSQIKTAIDNVIIPAMEQVYLMDFSNQSDDARDLAKEKANAFKDMVSESFSSLLAEAIDYYIRTISITGMVITFGSPVTQSATIVSMPTPEANGKVPNTLGIS